MRASGLPISKAERAEFDRCDRDAAFKGIARAKAVHDPEHYYRHQHPTTAEIATSRRIQGEPVDRE